MSDSEKEILLDEFGFPLAASDPVSSVDAPIRSRGTERKYALDPVPRKYGDSKTSCQATADWRERNRQKYNEYMKEYMKERRLKEKGEE